MSNYTILISRPRFLKSDNHHHPSSDQSMNQSSLISPSAVSEEFSFLDGLSPGIPLRSPSFALPTSPPPSQVSRKISTPEGVRIVEWGTRMVGIERMVSHQSFIQSTTNSHHKQQSEPCQRLPSDSNQQRRSSQPRMDLDSRSSDEVFPATSSQDLGGDEKENRHESMGSGEKNIEEMTLKTSSEDYITSPQSDDDSERLMNGERSFSHDSKQSIEAKSGSRKMERRSAGVEEIDYSMNESTLENYQTPESSPATIESENRNSEPVETSYMLEELQREMTWRETQDSEQDPIVEEVFAALDSQKRLSDLPPIGEETEMGELRRLGVSHRSAPSLDQLQQTTEWMPSEPEEMAPAPTRLSSREPSVDSSSDSHRSPLYTPNSHGVVHRRAVSDHYGHALERNLEFDESKRQEVRPRPKSMKSASTVAKRCTDNQRNSHNPLLDGSTTVDDGMRMGETLERTQSNSDPALNEKKILDRRSVGESQEQPPPVRLIRKANGTSWKQYMSTVSTSSHTFINTTMAEMNARLREIPSQSSIPSQTISHIPSSSVDVNANRPGESRIGKKRDKEKETQKGTTLFQNLFFSERNKGKGKGKERPRLNDVDFMQTSQGRSGSAPVQSQRRATLNNELTANGSFPGMPLVEGLPDDLASCMSPTGSGHLNDFDEGASESRLQLELPLWSRFGLFEPEEYNSWSKKYRTNNLPVKEVLRQDKIYELIMTEKHHCANLAFLKQAYRTRFIEDAQGISLSEKDIDILIPDVLDALLDFHTNLLYRLTERQKEGEQVETISDIIVEELSEFGEHTARAVNAYTTLGVNKEESEKYFDELKERALFRKYLENLIQSDPWYQKFEKFKSLYTRAMARTTRYHLILQDIVKNDLNEERREHNQMAVTAAKGFAQRIDQALSVSQMTKTWELIRERIDWTARTKIATNDPTQPLVDFYMMDLNSDKGASEGRRILCIGNVTVKPIGSDKFNGETSCTLILFDDVLVFLQRRQQRYVFFPQEQAVFAVSSLYPRAIERGSCTHLMSSSFKPMLMELQFRNKSDRGKWMDVFEKGISRAPKQVRLAPRRTDAQTTKEREKEEKRQREAEESWVKRLEQHFDERKDSEGIVAEYLDRRMQWFDRLRGIVNEMPFKSRQEIPEKVKATVRQRFRELRQLRVEPISKLVAKCTQARDQDLIDFFDDTAEVQYARLQTENDIQNLDSDSGSDSSGSEGKNLPRRVQTFHGTSTPKREKGSFRRHTTVPKMTSMGLHTASTSSASQLESVRLRMDEEDEEEEAGREERDSDQGDSTDDEFTPNRENPPDSPKTRDRNQEVTRMTQKLPLTMNLRARRAATQIIKENAELRQMNDRLRHDLAMSRTALSLYEKSRVAPLGTNGSGPSSVPASETHEALRRKEQELREGETRLNQEKDEFKETRTQIEERLKKQADELEERWRVLLEKETLIGGNHMREDRRTTPPTGIIRPREIPVAVVNSRSEPVSVPIISPALKSLAETKIRKKK